MSKSYLRLCILVGVAVAACGDDPVVADPVPCTDQSGTVAASGTVGQFLVFDWEPRCGVAVLLVEKNGGDDVWAITTDAATWDVPAAANQIVPPVTFGAVPTGVSELHAPESLEEGAAYDLVLWRIVADTTNVQCSVLAGTVCISVHTFVP